MNCLAHSACSCNDCWTTSWSWKDKWMSLKPDPGMASQQRGQLQTRTSSRHRSDHCQCTDRIHRGCEELRRWSSVGRLAGPCAKAALLWRQVEPVGNGASAGDSYLRTLLIHGARSVIYRAGQKADPCSWINAVVQRRNKNVAAVALANKNARTIWALLAHDRNYETAYTRVADAV